VGESRLTGTSIFTNAISAYKSKEKDAHSIVNFATMIRNQMNSDFRLTILCNDAKVKQHVDQFNLDIQVLDSIEAYFDQPAQQMRAILAGITMYIDTSIKCQH
jgi:hypothetical protein